MTRSLSFSPKRALLIATALPAAFAVVYWGLARWDSGGIGRLLLLAVVQLTPFVLALSLKKMDYLPIVLGSHFIGYTLAPLVWYFQGTLDQRFGASDWAALNTLIIAEALMLYVFHGARLFLYKNPYQQETFRKIEFGLKGYFALFGALLVSFALELFFPVSYPAFFSNLQFVLSVLAFCITLRGSLWPLRVLQGLLLVGTAYSFVVEANLGFSINLLAIWTVQALLQRRWRPFLKVGLLLVPMIVLQSVKSDYRHYTEDVPRSALGTRIEILYKILDYKYLSQHDFKPGYLVAELGAGIANAPPKGALGRVYDDSLNLVLEKTPAPVPYWEGRSYLFIIQALVPAWLWPGKPIPNMYNEYGHVYGILYPTDSITEVVFSYFAEAYMNFGLWWVYFLAMLLGVGFALLEKLSDLDLKGHYSFVFIIFLMPILSYQTAMGPLLQKVVYTALVVLPFRTSLLLIIKAKGKRLKERFQPGQPS